MSDTTCPATHQLLNSHCSLALNHTGRHYDANKGHRWSDEQGLVPPAPTLSVSDHKANCCLTHGCHFATNQSQENACPVANRTHKQDGPCPLCLEDEQRNIEHYLSLASEQQIAAELRRRGFEADEVESDDPYA